MVRQRLKEVLGESEAEPKLEPGHLHLSQRVKAVNKSSDKTVRSLDLNLGSVSVQCLGFLF